MAMSKFSSYGASARRSSDYEVKDVPSHTWHWRVMGINTLQTHPIFMERCDENYKIYSRQRTTTKYTRAAANMFSTSKEGVSNAKPYCPSQACTFMASHPGVRTTKTHRRYSLKSLSKLSRFPCCFKAPWSLLFILACATLPACWVTPWFRT